MTLVRVFLTVLSAAFVAVVAIAGASAQQEPLRVDVVGGHLDPLPIAIPDFVGRPGLAEEAGADIARVVTNDLQSTGLFRPLSEEAFIEDITTIDLRPRFVGVAGHPDLEVAEVVETVTLPLLERQNLLFQGMGVLEAGDQNFVLGGGIHGRSPLSGGFGAPLPSRGRARHRFAKHTGNRLFWLQG